MLLTIFSSAAAAVGVLMGTLFIFSIVIKKNDIVDIAWGPGIFLVALTSYLVAPSQTSLGLLLVSVCALWAFRLAYRIHQRNSGKEEDFRYKKWREEWGKWVYVRSFFQIYLLQGLLMLVLGSSFIWASYQSESFVGFSLVTALGLLLWLVGYYFEVIGDKQLDDFKKADTEENEVLDSGLWRYTRHPNYFGEVAMWWGIWFMIATLPMSYYALLSPIAITYLILYVSGVPMLEKKFAGNPAYEAYKERTSKFFPLPPKDKKSSN